MTTFAVTGMGRSGTKFLARAMNKVPGWTVYHEPTAGFRPTYEVQRRFDTAENNADNYGEVNSFLRFQLASLNVDRCAVILRDPIDIFQSMVNRGKPFLGHLVDALYALDGLLASGISPIYFSKMTQDAGYLRQVMSLLGVDEGIPEAYIDLTPVNVSTRFAPMPPAMVKEAQKKTD